MPSHNKTAIQNEMSAKRWNTNKAKNTNTFKVTIRIAGEERRLDRHKTYIDRVNDRQTDRHVKCHATCTNFHFIALVIYHLFLRLESVFSRDDMNACMYCAESITL